MAGHAEGFRIIADRLAKGLDLEPAALDPEVVEAAEQLLGTKLPLGDSRGH